MLNSTAIAEPPATSPVRVAVAPALAADSSSPVKECQMPGGLMVAYSPEQVTREHVLQYLTVVYGDLIDVTPEWIVAVAA
jgi:hypothetical protein